MEKPDMPTTGKPGGGETMEQDLDESRISTRSSDDCAASCSPVRTGLGGFACVWIPEAGGGQRGLRIPDVDQPDGSTGRSCASPYRDIHLGWGAGEAPLVGAGT